MSARLSRRIASRAREVHATGDAGITLMEVVVGMVLSTILGAMTLLVFVKVNSSTASTTDRTVSTASARNTLQAWTAYLRVADGTTAGSRANRFEWFTANDTLFYADIKNRSMSSVGTTAPPTMLWLRLDTAGQLVEEQFSATAAAGASPTTCRILAVGVSNAVDKFGTTVPLFSAANYSNAPLTGNLGSAPSVAAGCQALPVTVPSQTQHPDAVAQANLQTVYSVVIDFMVRDTKKQHPLEFTSEAVVPNLGAVG